jgi:hypothetical protein
VFFELLCLELIRLARYAYAEYPLAKNKMPTIYSTIP